MARDAAATQLHEAAVPVRRQILPRRLADVYVFCVLGREDLPKVDTDPLDIDQWAFYVLGRACLNRERPAQKKIRIKPLRQMAAEVRYGGLSAAVERAAAQR